MKILFLSAIIGLMTCLFSFGQGTVRGKISDTNGESIIGAAVVLKSNPSYGVTADLDGNYSLVISDTGVQTLRISFISYQTIEEIVHLKRGEVLIKNFVLNSSSHALQEVEITGRVVKAKEYYMEKIKINSASTLDYVSSESMKKTGDASVVAAVARVSGVSTNGNFITVRGIGDRYVKTVINGLKIPTLDPFTNNIKLDMIPASLVDNILITKTASPDLPGDWAGAYLSVETKDYPEQLSVNMESSIGYNNQSSFKDVLTSQRSTADWLGFGKNIRDRDHTNFVQANMDPNRYQEFVALGLGSFYKALGIDGNTSWNDTYYKLGLVELGFLPKAQFDDPGAVASAKLEYESGSYPSQAFRVINTAASKSGQEFPNNWNTFYRIAPLNFTQTLSIGNQIKLFGKPFGFIAGFRYGSSILYDPHATGSRASINSDNITYTSSQITEQSSKETNGWSALFNAAYKINSNNSISLLFMPNFIGTNKCFFNSDDAEITIINLTKGQFYEQRKQQLYQFKSEHYLQDMKLKIEFNASYTRGRSDAPDFKKLSYSKNPNAEIYQIGGERGINRSYRYLSEDLFDSRCSAEFPLSEKPALVRKLKFGGAYQDIRREYNQYEYSLLFGPKANLILENGDIEKFFSLENFGITTGEFNGIPYSTMDLYYRRTDNPSNHTIGNGKIEAGFVMVDYAFFPSFRFAGGIRIEHADLFTDAYKYDSLGLSADDPRRQFPGEIFTVHPGKLNEISYLPSANIIYKIKNDESAPANVRMNYSQTVARPSIRELSDVVVYDYELKSLVYGNSDLKMVKINNYDLRLESYFKSGDHVSLSVFYKDFKDHIELVDAPLGYTWRNVDKSWVRGVELEGRKSIIKNLELRANITIVKSQTSYLQKALLISNGVKTFIPIGNVTRTMYGQAPWVINGILGYKSDKLGLSLALSYNIQGPRLVITSFVEKLEVYELPRNLFDFKVTKSLGKYLTIGCMIKDILNSPLRKGYNDSLGFTDYDAYSYGTDYSLSIAYKF